MDISKSQVLEFSETTNDIRVLVIPEFNHERSNITQNSFIWIYTVRVENLKSTTIQLISRYWQIFDASGKVEEVRGNGVIGLQPIIKPHEFFEYKSQVRLFTSSGLMRGEYVAINLLTKQELTIKIPAFSLDVAIDSKNIN